MFRRAIRVFRRSSCLNFLAQPREMVYVRLTRHGAIASFQAIDTPFGLWFCHWIFFRDARCVCRDHDS